MEKKFLTEENYNRGKKKVKIIAIIILIIGVIFGGSLIAIGIIKQANVNSKYSENNKINLQQQLQVERQNLINKKTELKNMGESTSIIEKALFEDFDYCPFNEVKNNIYTSKYCSLKNQINNFDDFNKDFDSFSSIPFYMFGAFIIVATFIMAGSIYMISKRREILAFTTQQVMPVAKEGMEEMAPTIGNVAKEISKGIKEGLTTDNKDKY